jgi:hypothetical protein
MNTRKRKEDEKAERHKELIGLLTSIKTSLEGLTGEVKRSRKILKESLDVQNSVDETALDIFEKLEKAVLPPPPPLQQQPSEESSASLPPTVLYTPYPMPATEPYVP